MRKTAYILLVLVFSGLVLLPYYLAFQAPAENAVFQGMLVNPSDGQTYLAKMYQGWQGHWRFTLPFTSDPGEGVYLFLYYLFLGHLARWFGLPLILVYHLARWLGSLFMLWSLFHFFKSLGFGNKQLFYTFSLSILGAGLGWLFTLWGIITSDFWVAEAYPFLSAYTNPHFPLSLGLMIFLLREDYQKVTSLHRENYLVLGKISLATVCLALLSPFGVVLVLLIQFTKLLWQLIWQERYRTTQAEWIPSGAKFSREVIQAKLIPLLLISIFGLPILIYYQIIVRVHPGLSAWNAQNLTPTPPFWDVLISFSPIIFLAVFGALGVLRKNSWQPDTLVTWTVISLVLLFIPWGLQRRFMMGLYIPMVALAVLGTQYLTVDFSRIRRYIFLIVFLLSIPTPLKVILASWHGVETQDPHLFLSSGEQECLVWIEENTSPNALILASPDMGLFIPAQTGRRVVYGHHFETVHAESELKTLLQVLRQEGDFSQPLAVQKYLQLRKVDYLFWGAREAKIGPFPDWAGLSPVCSAGEVNLYSLPRK